MLYRRKRTYVGCGIGWVSCLPMKLLLTETCAASFVSTKKKQEMRPSTNSMCRHRRVERVFSLSHHLRTRVLDSSEARSPPPLGSPGDGAVEGGGGCGSGGGGDGVCRRLEPSPPQHSPAFGGDSTVCGLKRSWLSLSAGDKTRCTLVWRGTGKRTITKGGLEARVVLKYIQQTGQWVSS